MCLDYSGMKSQRMMPDHNDMVLMQIAYCICILGQCPHTSHAHPCHSDHEVIVSGKPYHSQQFGQVVILDDTLHVWGPLNVGSMPELVYSADLAPLASLKVDSYSPLRTSLQNGNSRGNL